MVVETGIYRDLAYIFGAALGGGLLARRLRQPLIIGYVLGGIVVGPFTPGPQLTGAHPLDLLAEIGVILLMYSIGIEFAPRDLAQVKGVALVGGPIGIALNILLAVVTGHFLSWSLSASIAIGTVLCVASTMVMSRLLIEREALTSLHGRIMIGITLVEDLAVVVMTVMLPALAPSSSEGRFFILAKDIAKAAVVLIPLIFLATRWVPSLMLRIARMRNPELYVLVVLALGLTTAAITQTLGLSLALGAFLAGMIVSDTEVAQETLQRLQPLRDAFAALFLSRSAP